MSNFSKQLGKAASVFQPGFQDIVNSRDQTQPEIQQLQELLKRNQARSWFGRLFNNPDGPLLNSLYKAQSLQLAKAKYDQTNAGKKKPGQLPPEDVALLQQHKLI